jgi:hypothetical protein
MPLHTAAAVAAYEAGSLGYSISSQGILLFYVLGVVKVSTHSNAVLQPGTPYLR